MKKIKFKYYVRNVNGTKKIYIVPKETKKLSGGGLYKSFSDMLIGRKLKLEQV
jgi:hypothetical protein